ncbi:AfsR/SARP family transcriptional regulator [Streptomyces sp. NPDC002076]
MTQTGEQGPAVFRVLGPLEVRVGDRPVELGGLRQQRLLATLLLEPNRVVPASHLAEAVWEEDPPATAAQQIRKTVAELRRRIPGGAALIRTEGVGYRTTVGDDQLDSLRFRALLRQARDGRGRDSAGTAALLEEALGLWRGPALDGLGGLVVQSAATALDDQRTTAAEQLYAIRLDQGAGSELIPDLRRFVSAHPLNERLRGQLMLALYRSARQAEALETYADIRRRLADELGVDPSGELSGLYEDILRNSPALGLRSSLSEQARADAFRPAPVPVGGPPNSLPYDLPGFTGRQEELRLLEKWTQGQSGEHLKIVSLEGMGGSGKTALAVHFAHRVRERYPDGQLYIDLAGFSPGREPLASGRALEVLLRTLGIPGERIPEDPLSRIALWRVTTAGLRLLVVLDNAADAAQVRPLLPSSADSLVLVTSRSRLAGLDGVAALAVGELTPEDCRALLVHTLGAERLATDPAAAEALIGLCGRLPLALRIAAGRFADRPRWTLCHLVRRLRNQERTLAELSQGDRSVESSIRLSYDAMQPERRRVFRLLGLFPGDDLDVAAAAALLGADHYTAEEHLEALVDVNLLEQRTDERYGFHDLVRSFVRALPDETTHAEDHHARRRLLKHYGERVRAAQRVLYRRQDERAGDGDDNDTFDDGGTGFSGSAQAVDWFNRERGNLVALLRLARDTGLPREGLPLVRPLGAYLAVNGNLHDHLDVAETGVALARALGETGPLLDIRTELCIALWGLSRYQEGIAAFRQNRELARSVGDTETEAICLRGIGVILGELGEYQQGLELLERAAEMHRVLGDPRRVGIALFNISWTSGVLGDYERAARCADEAVALIRAAGDEVLEVDALLNVAHAQAGLGRLEAGLTALARAEHLVARHRTRPRLARLAARSAELLALAGRHREAREHANRALRLNRMESSPFLSSRVHTAAGLVYRVGGEFAEALDHFQKAYTLASGIGRRLGEALALQGMADAHEALGDTCRARTDRELARAHFEAMGVPRGLLRTC